jgi:hypothetical protein
VRLLEPPLTAEENPLAVWFEVDPSLLSHSCSFPLNSKSINCHSLVSVRI